MDTRVSSLRWLGLIVAFAFCLGCQSAPVTERKQAIFISEASEIQMGADAFNEVVRDEPASEDPQLVEMVNRVGQRIVAASGKTEYPWQFHVIAKPDQNAFALPGGKVAVYEGIIPLCGSEAGLATVLSHEVAHVLARHGSERMTQQYAVNGLGMIVKRWTQGQDAQQQQMIEQVYGTASKYGVMLPYSRKHEYEADYIGLTLMSKAGYDPSEAPLFWERMMRAHQGGERPPEFLSTHPADENRIAALNGHLDEAMQMYAESSQLGPGRMIAANEPPSTRGIMASTRPANTQAGSAFTPTGQTTSFRQSRVEPFYPQRSKY